MHVAQAFFPGDLVARLFERSDGIDVGFTTNYDLRPLLIAGDIIATRASRPPPDLPTRLFTSCTKYVFRMRSNCGTGNGNQRAMRHRFIYLLNVAQRRVQMAVQGDVEGKTPARSGLLMALSADGGTPMGQLGPALDLGAPALSGLIDRMVRAGLIERRPDPADGRAWIIALTEAGLAAREDAIRDARTLNAQLCDGFSEAELEIVARWLEAVRDKFPKENDK